MKGNLEKRVDGKVNEIKGAIAAVQTEKTQKKKKASPFSNGFWSEEGRYQQRPIADEQPPAAYLTPEQYAEQFSYLSSNGMQKEGQEYEENSRKKETKKEEALRPEKAVEKIQAEFLTKTKTMSYKEAKEFHDWHELSSENKNVWLMFYHNTSPMRTSEIDYSRIIF